MTNQASSKLSDTTSHLVCCVCGCVLVSGRESVTLINMREKNNYGMLSAALGRGQTSTAVNKGQRLSKTHTEVQVCIQK